MHKAMFTIVVALLTFNSAAFSAAPKLDYRQEQSLKDATYYLDQVENLVANIEQRTKDAKPGDASIQESKVKSWVEWKNKADQYMTNTGNRLKQLPADNPKVKEQADRATKFAASLELQGKKLEEIQKGLSGVLAQGEGAGYKADFDRLKEINQTFANPQVIESNPKRAIEIIQQMEPAKAEHRRLMEKYADLLKQDSSKDLRAVLAYFDQVYPKFEHRTKDFAASAPAAIDKDITEATEMAKSAVAEKKFLFFKETGGVAQRLSWAQTKLDIFTAIDETAAAPSKQKLESARAEIAKMRQSLDDAIIAANDPPPDQYNGPDKAELLKIVKDKWATSGVDAPVLKVGINSKDWQRDTQWVWQRTGKYWYKIDASKSQGHVIVKLDDKTAVVHYIDLYKDHLKNDAISASFFDDPKAAVEVDRKLAVGKVK